jgi:hypothetical protein
MVAKGPSGLTMWDPFSGWGKIANVGLRGRDQPLTFCQRLIDKVSIYAIMTKIDSLNRPEGRSDGHSSAGYGGYYAEKFPHTQELVAPPLTVVMSTSA